MRIAEFGEKIENGLSRHGIEISGWFIGQNEMGANRQGPGNRDPLHLASAELVGHGIGAMRKPHLIDELRDAFFPLPPFHSRKLERKFDILASREGWEQVKKLEDRTDTLAPESAEFVLIEPLEGLLLDRDGSLVGPVDASDAVEEGAFARSRRSHQRNPLSRGEIERNPFQNRDFAIRFCYLGDLQRFHFSTPLEDTTGKPVRTREQVPGIHELPRPSPHHTMPHFPIKMPQLGESMAEATVREILIEPGAEVKADQNIFEVETDKAMMEVTTPCGGIISEVIAEIGTSYSVGTQLAFIEASEEDAIRAGLLKPKEEPESEAASSVGSGDSEANLHFAIDEKDMIETQPPGASYVDPRPVQPTVEGELPVPIRSSVYLSPRMRHRMEELGLNSADLAGLPGSGAGGRVTVEDFEKFIQEIEQSHMTDASPMRIAVADSMRRSWTRPLATVTVPVIMDEVLAHRKSLEAKPGVTLYAMRALAIALSENTAVAGRLIGNRIVHPNAIDIGFAVEAEDGVLVPVIRNVDQKSLGELREPYETLIQRAQERKLPADATGAGIATITNVGPFGITAATPIPLPEQNLVLGLMAGRKAPIWDPESGDFVPKLESQFILSFDHRILDGGAAGRLLQRVGELLQNPAEL